MKAPSTMPRRTPNAIAYCFPHLVNARYVEAIDVCNKVLAQYPDYPKIREEILCKAQALLRP